LFARDAAFGDGLADLRFVLVDLRSVDVAIAEFEAHLHRVDDLLILEAEGAEAEGGDGHRECSCGLINTRRRLPASGWRCSGGVRTMCWRGRAGRSRMSVPGRPARPASRSRRYGSDPGRRRYVRRAMRDRRCRG